MSLREASFGDLFKIGFWVQLGPVVLGVLLAGVMFSALTLMFPDLPELLAEAYILPIPATAYEGGTGPMLGLIWLVVLAYALFMSALVTLRTVSGALIVMMWRKTFRRTAAAG